jgi:hypothetical protein
MVEKRHHKRSPIELAASYGTGEDLRPERGAKINNVSSDGFCFTSDHKVQVGEEIQLAVDLDTVEEAVITVKVVWVKKAEGVGKYTVGVQIEEKDGPDFDRFIEFYEKID